MKNKLSFAATSLAVAGAFTFACSPVFALGSIIANGTTTGEVLVGGKVVEGSTSKFVDDFSEVKSDKVLEEITNLNDGEKLSDVLATEKVETHDLDVDLTTYSLGTKVQDLQAFDADGNALTEDVTATWEVNNLTSENADDALVLHYSTVREEWEVLKPESTDVANKTITCHFDDLSPVAVIYKTSESSTATESANTGTQTNVGVYAGVAVVAVAACGALVYKNKKK